MGSKDLFQRVRDLELPEGGYALFGSAPLGIRGLRPCDHDIDVIVTPDTWEDYRAKGWEIKRMERGSDYLSKDAIELWKDWAPGAWDIQALIREAETIDGLPCVRLERVLEWKKLSGREKDLKDVALIERFLRGEEEHREKFSKQ